MRKKPNFAAAAKYVSYLLLFALTAHAQTRHGLMPFALGLFVALVYSKENIWLLAPLYLLGSFAGGVSWQNLVVAASPPLVLAAAYFVHFKLKRPLGLVAINLYALLAQAPYIVLNVVSAGDLLDVALTVLLSQLFVYCCTIVVYAVKIRGLKYRFSLDEVVSTEVVAVVFAIAVACLELFGWKPFYGVAAFVILLAAGSFPAGVALAAAALFGLGHAFVFGSVAMCAVLSVWAVVAVSLRTKRMIFSAFGMIAADLLCAYYFRVYTDYSYLNLLSLCLGVGLALFLPKTFKQWLTGVAAAFGETYSSRTLVNRSRGDVAARLDSLSRVFSDMGSLLKNELAEPEGLSGAEKLSRDVCGKVCARCENLEACYGALGGDVSVIMEPIAEAVVRDGRATMLNMPPYICSRCKRIPELLSALNRGVRAVTEMDATKDSVDAGRQMVAEQMDGVGELLRGLSLDVNRRLNFNSDLEKKLTDELSHHNIIANDAAVYGEGSDGRATLVLRESDCNKPSLVRIVSEVVGAPLEICGEEPSVEGWRTLHFRAAPAFAVQVGYAGEIKYGNTVSGDSVFAERVADTYIVALSDGMGSGGDASRASEATLALIENFYRAGFPNEVVLSLTNRMLSLRGTENFSTLDILAVNLRDGFADIVKLGATDGILKRGRNTDVVESRGLPVGILDKIAPTVDRRQLASGDLVVMTSDGAMDVLGQDGIIELLSTLPPDCDALAKAVLDSAKNLGLYDDATVLVVKVI